MKAARSMILLIALMSLVAGAVASDATSAAIQILKLQQSEFQPASGEKITIPYALRRGGAAELVIYTGDGDVVRTLKAPAKQIAGTYAFTWDGKDDLGKQVPDEAYHPVLRCDCGEPQPTVFDARINTGGEVIEKIRVDLTSDGTVGFDLPHDARTLVRVGIKGGAMMRAIDTWSPRAAGRVRLEWDGLDQSGVQPLLGQSGLTVLVTAFRLPDHSILVSGNNKVDYFAYRKARGWTLPVVDASKPRLERNGRRLSRQASFPRSALPDPRVTIDAADKLPRHESGAVIVSGPVTFRVDMPAEDKWLVQQSLYEVGFFLDHQFVSEEETGYTPISWRWDPAGVTPGEHVMTVNISGFWGQVGVASMRIWVQGK